MGGLRRGVAWQSLLPLRGRGVPSWRGRRSVGLPSHPLRETQPVARSIAGSTGQDDVITTCWSTLHTLLGALNLLQIMDYSDRSTLLLPGVTDLFTGHSHTCSQDTVRDWGAGLSERGRGGTVMVRGPPASHTAGPFAPWASPTCIQSSSGRQPCLWNSHIVQIGAKLQHDTMKKDCCTAVPTACCALHVVAGATACSSTLPSSPGTGYGCQLAQPSMP
jgi:hypothetical protein